MRGNMWDLGHDLDDLGSAYECCTCKRGFTTRSSLANHNCNPRGEKRKKGPARVQVLTEPIVMEMREKYAAGNVTHAELAEQYSVNQSTAANAISGKSFKHLPMPENSKRYRSEFKKLDDKERAAIRADYAAGMHRTEIANKYNRGWRKITEILEASGHLEDAAEGPHGRRRPNAVPEEEKKAIREARASGMSIKAIKRKFNRSWATVNRIVEEG